MKKGRIIFPVIGALLLVMAALPVQSTAGVNVNIGIDVPLPTFVFTVPPSVVVIPGSYVYYAPGIDVDLLFYNGFWYRPYRGRWYRSGSYEGRWICLAPSRVPRALLDLPHDYRDLSHGRRRIAYGELTRNWKRWERERYWDDDGHDQGYGPMGHMGHMGRMGGMGR